MKREPSQIQPPGLYIIATPIGNLRDITLRALDVLGQADLIVCEDTRQTAKLLQHYGISAPTLSYNDHNGEARRPKILQALQQGQRVALVSDAGTPLISDPGHKLVREALGAGLYVTTLPGASSVLAALCLSGLPSERFFFAGFLPAKEEACRKDIQQLRNIPSSLIFFESAKRLQTTLQLLQELLGERQAAVVREITKLYEESQRGSLKELCAHYHAHGEPKGEVVLVIGPPGEDVVDTAQLATILRQLLETHSVKDAVALAAEATGLPRKQLYRLALDLQDNPSNAQE